MATIAASGPKGLNMRSFDFGFFSDLRDVVHSSTSFARSDEDGNSAAFTGADLTYGLFFNRVLDIYSGTFTSLIMSVSGQNLSFTNWDLSAAHFFDLFTLSKWKSLAAETVSGNDRISGTSHKDVLVSGVGRDTLIGGAGDDKLNGGAGDDKLVGGKGSDILTGGSGSDSFVFDQKLGATSDTIKDFQHGVDHILLDKTFFDNVGVAGVMSAEHFHLGTGSTAKLQGVIYDGSTGFLWSDSDGSGPLDARVFAHLQIGLGLTASDFLILA